MAEKTHGRTTFAGANVLCGVSADVGYNCFRALCAVDDNERMVRMLTIGAKQCGRLLIGEQKFEPEELPRIIDGFIPTMERNIPLRG